MARSTSPDERTPLVPAQPGTQDVVKRGWFPSLHRVLFTTCLLALTFAFTQTSLMYGFRRMTCEDYYLRHPDAIEPVPDRCTVRRIEADTAGSISIMATSTMTFSEHARSVSILFCLARWYRVGPILTAAVVNVFLTGWWIRRYGPKSAMFQQSFWLCFRNMCQMYAISHGGRLGINIIQSTQVFNVLGSAGGYQLAANAYVALLVDADRRTGMFGVLSGMVMLGNSAGYSLGGLTERLFGPLAPFQTAFCMLVFCTIFGALCLPYIAPTRTAQSSDGKKSSGAASVLAPLALFVPRRIVYEDGSKGPRQWSLLFLALGAFFSVFATAFVPLGLQLVSTNVFGFRPAETGLMLSLTLLVKAFFLSICFPAIIKYGRKWYTRPASRKTGPSGPITFTSTLTGKSIPDRAERSARNPSEATLIDSEPVSPKTIPLPLPAHPSVLPKTNDNDPSPESFHPEDPHEVVLSTPARPDQIAIPEAPTDVQHGSTFDLHFLRYSILLDAILTSLTSLMNRGEHVFVAAAILPLASGTGAACKGVATDFVDADTRASVLSAIALVENLATVSTACLFGFVFAALSEAGLPTLVFLVNGCMALIAFFVLLLVRMPRVQTHLA